MSKIEILSWISVPDKQDNIGQREAITNSEAIVTNNLLNEAQKPLEVAVSAASGIVTEPSLSRNEQCDRQEK